MAGVTAASCQLTADAGTFALEKGGNAVDALIAAQLIAVSDNNYFQVLKIMISPFLDHHSVSVNQ